MYSHFMNGVFSPLALPKRQSTASEPTSSTFSSTADNIPQLLKTLGKRFKLSDFDTGDLLLLLIILLLLLEGDNLELVITLGLIILLGLND